MTTTQRWVVGGVGLAVSIGLAVLAWVVAGRDGLEAVSWVAGIGSFLLAAVTVLMTVTPAGSAAAGRVLRFNARARDNAQIIQAGGNVTKSGNRRR